MRDILRNAGDFLKNARKELEEVLYSHPDREKMAADIKEKIFALKMQIDAMEHTINEIKNMDLI